jgi:hypothetical protein
MDQARKTQEKTRVEQKRGKEDLYFFGLVDSLLSDLNERSQDIIRKRFGLTQEKPETLEKIGSDYRITRERVRQIVTDAVKNISSMEDNPRFKEAEKKLIFTIDKFDGIIKENELVKKVSSDGFREANAIKFIAQCSKNIYLIEEKDRIHRSWATLKLLAEDIRKVEKIALEIFEAEEKLLSDEELAKKVALKIEGLTKNQILAFLKVLNSVQKNRFGKWGKANWTEVNPKGTREKIYLILKEQKSPLHFTEIANLIDKYNLGKKKAHPQTVHNELIKDKRFVLIGRGIYAMREWGYQEGTIKDVLKEILSKKGRPMKKEDIIEEVLKIRKVKKTTVMINLNNAKLFSRTGDLYAVKR